MNHEGPAADDVGPPSPSTHKSPRRGRARAEFECFVEGSADRLLRTGYLIVWDLEEAEDLVQETLLRVARRWPRVRTMDKPHAYARQILVNLALDGGGRRARRRHELAGGEALHERPDRASARALADLDTRAELLAALGALPPRQRAVLVLRYFEDLPEAQVAQALGCSQGTVKSSASRGLARLREALQPVEPVPVTGETKEIPR
ncbi:MAG TPA: SigE family RNA polymerase sigma factor [Solirubrobacteraceae bacterium]|jgi:RNA polymerase sigma-70 factor (sigma-E family)|nr:SigE family RNA polymerase sigma factor [Solirubrobacteraceae bacterium]